MNNLLNSLTLYICGSNKKKYLSPYSYILEYAYSKFEIKIYETRF